MESTVFIIVETREWAVGERNEWSWLLRLKRWLVGATATPWNQNHDSIQISHKCTEHLLAAIRLGRPIDSDSARSIKPMKIWWAFKPCCAEFATYIVPDSLESLDYNEAVDCFRYGYIFENTCMPQKLVYMSNGDACNQVKVLISTHTILSRSRKTVKWMGHLLDIVPPIRAW